MGWFQSVVPQSEFVYPPWMPPNCPGQPVCLFPSGGIIAILDCAGNYRNRIGRYNALADFFKPLFGGFGRFGEIPFYQLNDCRTHAADTGKNLLKRGNDTVEQGPPELFYHLPNTEYYHTEALEFLPAKRNNTNHDSDTGGNPTKRRGHKRCV